MEERRLLLGIGAPGFFVETLPRQIVPTLLATWVVWAPLMAIIYSLPYPLQFPLFSLALTFWVLLLTYMTNRFAGKIEADAPLALSVAGRRLNRGSCSGGL